MTPSGCLLGMILLLRIRPAASKRYGLPMEGALTNVLANEDMGRMDFIANFTLE